jgi:hypothetical protein
LQIHRNGGNIRRDGIFNSHAGIVCSWIVVVLGY